MEGFKNLTQADRHSQRWYNYRGVAFPQTMTNLAATGYKYRCGTQIWKRTPPSQIFYINHLVQVTIATLQLICKSVFIQKV